MDQIKRNRKMTYGVHKYTSYKETPFMKNENLVYKEHKHCIVIWDKYPVCDGHLLFVPKLNKQFHVTIAFKCAIDEGKYQVNKGLIDGYHVGVNMHRAGGQTVEWPHVHFIPRLLHDSGTKEIGSVRLARVGGKLANSYNHHPEFIK